MLCQPVVDDIDSLSLSFPLASTALFGAMNFSQVDKLWSLLKIKYYAVGETIFRQGELPSNIYVVVDGQIELSVGGKEGDRVADTFSSGDAFGVTSVLGIQTQLGTAKVSALEGATVLVLSRDALISLEREHLDIFSLLIMNAARHVSRKLHRELVSK